MAEGKIFLALFKKEVLGLIRSKQLIILAALFLLFGILSPVSARFMRELVALAGVDVGDLIPIPTYLDAIAQFIKNISQTLSLILIFLFMGIMAGVKSKKTAHFVLVKPVSRVQFFLAKLFTLWLAVVICTLVSGLLCYGYTLLIFGEITFAPFISMLAMLTIYLLFLVTLVTCCSTLYATSTQAALVSFLVWIGLMIQAGLPRIGIYSPGYFIGMAQSQFLQIQWPWQTLVGTGGLCLLLVSITLLVFRKWEP